MPWRARQTPPRPEQKRGDMPETKLKLSAAIRKGCEGTRQVYNVFFEGHDGRDAMAAAMAGAGFSSLAFIHDFREKYHDELRRKVKCPDCIQSGPVEDIIVHMGDDHRMTRELIADFLESREL